MYKKVSKAKRKINMKLILKLKKLSKFKKSNYINFKFFKG